jgi:uncharacterized membrane protein (UPF0127 family)
MAQSNSNTIIPLFENFCRKNRVDGKTIDLKLGSLPISAKVASTPRTQSKGYMEESEPSDGEGMIFVYDKEEPLSFWMKNVNFPLDIVFFDSNLNYIDHQTMEKFNGEEDDRLPRYSSSRPAQFAVELPAGWCDKNLEPECKLSF